MTVLTDESVRLRCPSCDGEIVANASDSSIRCPTCGKEFSSTGGVFILGKGPDSADYPEELYALLAQAESKHFWFRARNRLIISTLREAIGPLGERSVLDVGCGTGFVLAALEGAGMTVVGLDMHLEGLRYARERTHGALFCSPATTIPFRAQFDAVMLCDVIEHATDDRDILREAAQSLKPGGRMIITVPAHQWLWSWVDDLWGHRRRYSKRSLRDTIEGAGLAATAIRYFNTLIVPAQFLERLRNKTQGGPELGAVNDFRESVRVPPAFINSVLLLLALCDLPLSRLPRMPGGSLIAIVAAC